MADRTITFEQVDAAFKKLEAAGPQAAVARFTAAEAAANPASVIGSICPIYAAVRPFLEAASNFPLLPAAWRTGIKAFIAAVDLLCPQHC